MHSETMVSEVMVAWMGRGWHWRRKEVFGFRSDAGGKMTNGNIMHFKISIFTDILHSSFSFAKGGHRVTEYDGSS